MPLTPFHLGPGLFFGTIFRKYLDFLAFLIGNVILDIEPLLVVVYEQFLKFSPYPHHGFLHTIIGALLMSFLATLILKEFQQIIRKILSKCLTSDFKHFWEQSFNFNKIFFSVFSGILLHLILDSFTHRDVWPFWPFHFNPLLELISFPQNHINCLILGILGIVLLIFKIKREFKKS